MHRAVAGHTKGDVLSEVVDDVGEIWAVFEHGLKSCFTDRGADEALGAGVEHFLVHAPEVGTLRLRQVVQSAAHVFGAIYLMHLGTSKNRCVHKAPLATRRFV